MFSKSFKVEVLLQMTNKFNIKLTKSGVVHEAENHRVVFIRPEITACEAKYRAA